MDGFLWNSAHRRHKKRSFLVYPRTNRERVVLLAHVIGRWLAAVQKTDLDGPCAARNERSAMGEKGAQNGDFRDLPAAARVLALFCQHGFSAARGADSGFGIARRQSDSPVSLQWRRDHELCHSRGSRHRRGVKNIYWQYDETRTDVRWLSDEVVSINGVVLNIYEDIYDYRRNSR